jgi:hypothetical protein
MSAPRQRQPLNVRELVPASVKAASNDITADLRYKHDKYIIDILLEPAVHNIYNYTFHGDVMINNLLRTHDTLRTYFYNIPDPSQVEIDVIDEKSYKEADISGDTPPIMFLPLYEMESRLATLYSVYGILPYKEYEDEYYSRDDLMYGLPNEKKLDMYNRFKEQYYKFLNLIQTEQLGQIRTHIYNIARNIHLTLCNAPHYTPAIPSNAYFLYRVVRKFYLSTDPETITTVCSFVSSTISSTKANELKEDGRFGKKIYVFQVHPLCVGMCIDLISYYEREDEFLLGFGCKFLFMRELHKNAQLFAVIPQVDPSGLLPPTYDEYIAKYYRGPRYMESNSMPVLEPNSMPALESASSQNGGVLKLTLRARARPSRRIPISKRTIRTNMGAKRRPRRKTVRSMRATNAGNEQLRGDTVRSMRATNAGNEQLRGDTVRSMPQRQVKPLNFKSSKYKKSSLYDRDGDLRDGIYEVRPITEAEKALVAQMG